MKKIKRFVPFIFGIGIVIGVIISFEKKAPFSDDLDVKREYAKVLTKAKSESKNILIEFGANWCLDCHALSDILSREPVKSYIRDHYVLLPVDVGKFDRNLDFSKQFGDPIQNGIPALVVLSSDGMFLVGTNNGEFANARGLKDFVVLEFLKKWRK